MASWSTDIIRKPEQIDLDDAEGGAVVLVPLDHHPARHGGRLQRHDVVEPAGGDHHPARVLAEMARQILHARPQGGERADARMARDRSPPRPGAA